MSVNKEKILGIDYGDFTIGLSIFDLETDFICPLKTIYRNKANILRKSIREIVDVINEMNISEIVIGFPLNANGTEGDRVEKVKNFKRMLENAIVNNEKAKNKVIKIEFQDERLTTYEAKEILKSRSVKKEDWKKDIDQISACIILNDFKQAKKI